MLAFALGAIGAAVIHDRFYNYLNGKSAEGCIFTKIRDYGVDVTDQSLVNFFSNLITKAAVACFSTAIGTAFIQLFWWKMSLQPYTIRNIDGLMDFKAQPLNPFSWKSAITFRILLVVAVCITVLQIGSALLPGSLTVDFAYFPSPCSVATVDLKHADLANADDIDPNTGERSYYIANGRASAHVAQVLVAGRTFPPASTCGVCQYNVTFTAPAVRCNNITQEQIDIIDNKLSVFPDSNHTTVWNAYMGETDVVYVMSRNLLTDSQERLLPSEALPVVALACTGWNATYNVMIDQDATTRMITNVNIENQITCGTLCQSSDTTGQQLLGLWDAFFRQLNGTIVYSTTKNEFTLDVSLAAWSAVGRGSSTGIAWQWAGDLQQLIPEIMQNVSLSLLAGDLNDDEHSTTSPIPTTCMAKGLQFRYDADRLRGVYGAALGIVAVCIGCGFMAYKTNKRSETMNFSRILAAYPERTIVSEAMTLETKVQAGQDGRLIPVAQRRISTMDTTFSRFSHMSA